MKVSAPPSQKAPPSGTDLVACLYVVETAVFDDCVPPRFIEGIVNSSGLLGTTSGRQACLELRTRSAASKIGSMGLDSNGYALVFDLLRKMDLPKDGLRACEEIAWTL